MQATLPIIAKHGESASTFISTQCVPFCVKFAVYPFERQRLIAQTRHIAQDGRTWRSMLQEWRQRTLGMTWRGFGPTVIRWAPNQYLTLYIKDHLTEHIVPRYSRDESYQKYFWSKVGAGAVTGLATALVWAYPLDVMRQQLATSGKECGGWCAAARRIHSKGGGGVRGLRGFYRGFLMDAPGLMIFRGVQLGGWDLLKDWHGRDAWEKKAQVDQFFWGQLVSLFGSVCAYPCDTIRRNLIRTEGNSYWVTLKQGRRDAGSYLRFFYAGFHFRLLTSFVNGALLVYYDQWKRQAN
eukprot:TRINITY_DN637_c0_g1_i5.p1 TRINITY_DN637_c0_g1~~TRINITY_DN637_c0_g1_i5.p1  ORF type:complete len:323 (+),score=109.77 TRINITY_DN637_c0_g1_i5:87-971(+)